MTFWNVVWASILGHLIYIIVATSIATLIAVAVVH